MRGFDKTRIPALRINHYDRACMIDSVGARVCAWYLAKSHIHLRSEPSDGFVRAGKAIERRIETR